MRDGRELVDVRVVRIERKMVHIGQETQRRKRIARPGKLQRRSPRSADWTKLWQLVPQW